MIMKKFYNSPVVEITVFDVEDVITTSAISTQGMNTEDFVAEVAKDANVTIDNTVAWDSAYNW